MYIDATGSSALGVQQPYEIFVIPAIEPPRLALSGVTVYPNPVLNQLTISLDEDSGLFVVAVLYDITGQTMERITVQGREALLDLSTYARAVYFLQVYFTDHSKQIFRIVKN
jgi:hypothetical protein